MARDEGPQLRNRLRTTRARTLCRDGGNGEEDAETQSYSGSASCQPKLIAIRSRSLSMVA